jgi:hypothetical protein
MRQRDPSSRFPQLSAARDEEKVTPCPRKPGNRIDRGGSFGSAFSAGPVGKAADLRGIRAGTALAQSGQSKR